MVAPPVGPLGVMAADVAEEVSEPGRLVVLAEERVGLRVEVWADGVMLIRFMVREWSDESQGG